jgi:uncharacterized protein YodC (DUF2158 family)
MSDVLKPGNIVKLKSGGPDMTVITAVPFATGKGLRGYQCEHFEDEKPIRGVYSPDSLEVISGPSAT